MREKVLLVLCNAPDAASAERLACLLVEQRLAACVNQLAPCLSRYHWQGKIEVANEVPLLIKTTAARYPALEAALLDAHPYNVPEILAFEATAGLPAYLSWVAEETTSKHA